MNQKITWKTLVGNLDIIISGAALAILILLTFIGVIMRYVIGHPITWMEEVQLFCMVWIVFGAGGAAYRTHNHTAIEILVDAFPQNLQKIVGILIDVIVVVVIGYLFINSIGFVQVFLKSGRDTSILHIPLWLQYGIAPVSYIIMVLSYFWSKYIDKSVREEEY